MGSDGRTMAGKVDARKATSRKSPGRATPAAGKPAARRSARPRKITPRQALANTRKLLEAKHEHDRQPPPWRQVEGAGGAVQPSGYQSPEAAARAEELHAAESRIPAIQGSIGTQDRHNQGKRDKR
jgi:hypothetical protein